VRIEVKFTYAVEKVWPLEITLNSSVDRSCTREGYTFESVLIVSPCKLIPTVAIHDHTRQSPI